MVLKLHGCISSPSTIVFTGDEFGQIIHNSPEIRNFINALLTTKTFIFLGFSFSDPHLDSILSFLQNIKTSGASPHYALIADLSDVERSQKESAYGLRIIPYKPNDNLHPEVFEFINLFRAVFAAADGQ